TIFDHYCLSTGLVPVGAPPTLHVLAREIASLGLEDDGDDGLVVAFSADSKEPDRRWGEERFATLARHIEKRHGAGLVELGNGLTAGHLGVGHDLVGQTTLRQSMAVLSLCDLFVGNHGGLTHLAGGVGTPVLVPWGASTPYQAYAYDTQSHAVETKPACRHCAWTGRMDPVCETVDMLKGRTRCTQEISVEEMIAAADQWIPLIREQREVLRARRRMRVEAARDPASLSRFDEFEFVSASTHRHLFIGGKPGWGREHRVDNFLRLRKVVAFPDWSKTAWQDLITTFISQFRAPWTLVLSAHPLTGPQVLERVMSFLKGDLGVERGVPPILIVTGLLTEAERRDLVFRSEGYLPLDSSLDLPNSEKETTLVALADGAGNTTCGN
ncbi:MAG: hypothetical protein KGR26_00005, partial [Cyanobacteria bacterium REEB65]|nr:hypothetical protein [Cyanobacteria bacterium REEB65]